MRIRSLLPFILGLGVAFGAGILVRPRIEPALRIVYRKVVPVSWDTGVPTPRRILRGGETGRVPVPRFEPAVAVAGGRLYLLGGFLNRALHATARCDVFDPGTRSWRRIADMPVAVTHAGVAVVDDEIWVAGGFVGRDPGPATPAVWRYHIPSDKWSTGPMLPQARGAGGLANVGGVLHYIGGLKPDRQSDSGDHWALAPSAAEWRPRAALPSARNHFSVVVRDGLVHVLGGQHGHDVSLIDVKDHHVFDAASGSWRPATPLPRRRSHTEPGAFLAQGLIFLAGGRSNDLPVLYDFDVYDAASGKWHSLPALPAPMRAPVARVVGSHFYTGLGGTTASGVEPSDLWMTFPLGELGLKPAPTAAAP